MVIHDHARIDGYGTMLVYDQRIETYTTKPKVRLALLKLEATPRMSPERRSQLTDRLQAAREEALTLSQEKGRGGTPPGFGSLAIRASDDAASRYRGGDIGWLEKDRFEYRWPKPVLEAGYALQQGDISGIIEADDGLYLVLKTDERPEAVTEFETVKERLAQTLKAEKQNRIRMQLHQDAVKAFPASINQEVLDSIVLPSLEEKAVATLHPHPADSSP